MTENKKDSFDDLEKVKSNWWVKGKIGDQIKGTLVDIRKMDDLYHLGKKVTNYEFLAHSGFFHELETKDGVKIPVAETTEINAGEYWMVGGNKSIGSQMRNIKIGQIVGIRFDSTEPSKTQGWAPAKIIKVYQGGMDEEWLKGQTGNNDEISADDIGKAMD